MTASDGGKERVGPVGRPRRCAAAVSIAWPWTGWPATPRRVVSLWAPGGGATGFCGGFCAASVPPRTTRNTTSAAVRVGGSAAALRRARRRVMTQAHRMLTS